jgi:hypothetical protein
MEFRPFLNILTDKSLIFEFDDVVPTWMADSGENHLKTFSFEYGHHGRYLDDGQPYFGKILFLREKNIDASCPYLIYNLIDLIQLTLLPSIDPNGKFYGLQRVAVNGQLPGQNAAKHIDHDMSPNMWTAVYYANDSDGDTVFFRSLLNENDIVSHSKFKKGKIIIFPSYFLHQAMTPTSSWRITIGITFEWHSHLSKFKKDHDLR